MSVTVCELNANPEPRTPPVVGYCVHCCAELYSDVYIYDSKHVCKECYEFAYSLEAVAEYIQDCPRLFLEYLKECLTSGAPDGLAEILTDFKDWSNQADGLTFDRWVLS